MGARLTSTFAGLRALITGGSSGIGLACAQRLAALGASLTLVARRQELLDAARASLLAAAPTTSVETVALDVTDVAAVRSRLAAHIEQHPVDVLLNNAGVVMPGRFLELEERHLREMMEVNYFGAVNVCRVVLPHLVARGGGAVLNTSSMAGAIGIYGYTGYAASKFALLGFSEALRAEMWPHGVRVSVCLPPDTDTPQLEFENRYKPAETRAIAGNVRSMSAAAVAEAMLSGLAARRFVIVPGTEAQLMFLAQRVAPAVVRWIADRSQRSVRGG